MFDFLQPLIAEWGLFAGALLCFALAFAAFAYVPVLGEYIAYALIALGVALIAYDLGYQARGNLDNSGAIQAQLDEANRELSATQKIAADADAAAQAAALFNQSQQEKIRAYDSSLKARPRNGGCALTDDDVRGLSDIASPGAPDAARSAPGVRKAGPAPGAQKR